MIVLGPKALDEWIMLLRHFGLGDDMVVAEMQHGALELTSRELGRWQTVLRGSLRRRLRQLSMELDERIEPAVTAGGISSVLGWARGQVTVLYCFSNVSAFPATVRIWIERYCRRWLEQTQARLERGAAHSSEPDLLLLTVRRSPLRWPPRISMC